MKVFGIGMFKTGTKSLGVAFRMLGIKPVKDRPWFALKDRYGRPDNWYNDPKAWNVAFPKIKEVANAHKGFADAPWIFLYKQLDKWYPGSKFILTTRKNPGKVALSDQNQWAKNHKVKDIPKAKIFMDRYNKHNAAVRKYFKGRDNFLEICFETDRSWKKLCRFLDKPVPNKPFPHSNKGKKKLKRLII